jgi:hypothetical protein
MMCPFATFAMSGECSLLIGVPRVQREPRDGTKF